MNPPLSRKSGVVMAGLNFSLLVSARMPGAGAVHAAEPVAALARSKITPTRRV
jgi:hypothetical protein